MIFYSNLTSLDLEMRNIQDLLQQLKFKQQNKTTEQLFVFKSNYNDSKLPIPGNVTVDLNSLRKS